MLHLAREHARKTILDNITKSENLRLLKRKKKELHRKITCLEEALYLENPCAEVPLSSFMHYKVIHAQEHFISSFKIIDLRFVIVLIGTTLSLFIIWLMYI